MLRPQGTRVVGVYPGPVDTDMAKPLPLEKVTPRAAADAILDGLEAEAEEIYPDPTARQFGDGWRDDPKGLEAMVAGMSVGA
jgi:NAD(P)-dependent dehydrogenase (short-subunit alcohol dehydrogenase family)